MSATGCIEIYLVVEAPCDVLDVAGLEEFRCQSFDPNAEFANAGGANVLADIAVAIDKQLTEDDLEAFLQIVAVVLELHKTLKCALL